MVQAFPELEPISEEKFFEYANAAINGDEGNHVTLKDASGKIFAGTGANVETRLDQKESEFFMQTARYVQPPLQEG